MTSNAEPRTKLWNGVDAVIAGYAGTRTDRDAFGHALSVMRAALPGVDVWLLWPAGSSARGLPAVDGRIDYPSPAKDVDTDEAARRAAHRALHALAASGANAALIFTQQGHSPHTAAYLCYLAGISYRAGIGGEFGGALLSPALPPPRIEGPGRHLALLAAVGIEVPPILKTAGATAAISTTRSRACDR